jgi:biopolymer transport protein TolQ
MRANLLQNLCVLLLASAGLTYAASEETPLAALPQPQEVIATAETVAAASPRHRTQPPMAEATTASVPLGMPAIESAPAAAVTSSVDSGLLGSNVFTRGAAAGPVVFGVLLILILLSIFSWAILLTKWVVLGRLEQGSQKFSRVFWESRSLNDLNQRIQEYPHSPIREAFRNGYAELVRSNPLKDQALTPDMGLSAAMDNVQRTLHKTKAEQKRAMERFLPVLALTASAAPFIGLFGTVWGIMNAFEGIAQTGSTSLASVAPGISEALIATAFGLAAAIPAVVGYNLAQNKIRGLLLQFDGFKADFLNIIERYLVSDRGGKGTASPSASAMQQTPRL